jgi:inner membrane protein
MKEEVMRFPLLSKVAAIGAIVVLLMIALTRIGFLVDERRMRQREAVQSVEQALSGAQTLLGPLMHRSCTEEWDVVSGEGKERRVSTDKREFMLAAVPDRLSIQGSASLDPHHRGLFKVNGYAGRLVLEASWRDLAALQPQRERAGSRLQCGSALLMLAVSDSRGIRSAQLALGGQPLVVRPGTFHGKYPRGLHAVVPDAALSAASPEAPLQTRLTLELLGTGQLAFTPAADSTEVNLRSDWPHPSFGGRFLPAAQQVGDAGFSAAWRISALATSAPRDILKGAPLCDMPASAADDESPAAAIAKQDCLDTLGVSFIDPVNPYVLSDRAIKYGLLFVVLTFVAVALVEVLARRRVHPIQYLLVGLALSLFFLLLLSLSEHLPFEQSYAIAAAAGVALLAYYATHVLGGLAAGALFGAGIAMLYGALYALLQMEQTALVIGSVMLFAVLAAVMVLTRRVDWYALFDGLRAAPGQAPRAVPKAPGMQGG